MKMKFDNPQALVANMHEWDLASMHKDALEKENYELCGLIQKEVDRRISDNTIDHALMQGFRYYNPDTSQFEGLPRYTGLNGLFRNYNFNNTINNQTT